MPIARIDSVMTSYPYVIELDALAATARTMMQQLKVRHLPVREGDKVVGVVTEQVLQMAEACGRDLTGSGIKVRDLCSRTYCWWHRKSRWNRCCARWRKSTSRWR